MTVQDVLWRVEEDLARGHTFVAVQRLTTLVQANPKDIDVRLRLAQVHLAMGNFVQAGRWFYLTEHRDDRATVAFEKAYRDPRAREDALRWALDRAHDPEHVVAILTQLRRDINLVSPPSKDGELPLRALSQSGGDWAWSLVAVASAGVFLLGLITLVRWVWPG